MLFSIYPARRLPETAVLLLTNTALPELDAALRVIVYDQSG